MGDIPVTFNYKGKEYHGVLSPVSNAGSLANYHLMVNKRYIGELYKTATGWRFTTQKGILEKEPGLLDYFIACASI